MHPAVSGLVPACQHPVRAKRAKLIDIVEILAVRHDGTLGAGLLAYHAAVRPPPANALVTRERLA